MGLLLYPCASNTVIHSTVQLYLIYTHSQKYPQSVTVHFWFLVRIKGELRVKVYGSHKPRQKEQGTTPTMGQGDGAGRVTENLAVLENRWCIGFVR